MTEYFFHLEGKIRSSRERLNNENKEKTIKFQQLYRSYAEIPSGPLETLFFKEQRATLRDHRK